MAMFARVCDELGIVIMRWKPPAARHATSVPAAPGPLPVKPAPQISSAQLLAVCRWWQCVDVSTRRP